MRWSPRTDGQVLGLSVRVVHDGVWGFAADIALTADSAARLAERAVATAKVSRPLTPVSVELADEPVYPDATWVSAYEINPFDVDEADEAGRMLELNEVLLAAPGVSHADAMLAYVQENKFFANLAGTTTTQQRVRIQPQLTAVSVGDHGFATMRTHRPAGRARLGVPDRHRLGLRRRDRRDAGAAGRAGRRAVGRRPGHYDLVIHPSNLFLTIHESIGHATELDRALGYEAAYAGTSFATFDQLGTLHYGSPVMNVTGDRVVDHGLATIGYDDEGVGQQQFDLIRDGTLVGYQLNRQMAAEKDLGRSNGCAYADSPGHIPMQRMPNVSLQPAPDGPVHRGADLRRSTAASTSSATSPGRSTCSATTSSSPGSGSSGSSDGRLAGQLKDVAYQATTTDFWRSMEAVGNADDLRARRRVQLRQGPAGPGRSGVARLPVGAVPRVNVLNTQAEGSRIVTEPARTRSRTAGTGRAGARAGHPADRRRRHRAHRGQPALGEQRADHQRRDAQPHPHRDRNGARSTAARRPARSARRSPVPTASPPSSPRPSGSPGAVQPPRTPCRLVGRLPARRRLGRRTGDDRHRGARRAGAEHSATPSTGRGQPSSCCSASPSTCVTTTYLGSSTGLRRRGVQPTGRLELNAKTGRPDRLGLGRAPRPATSPTWTSPSCTPS